MHETQLVAFLMQFKQGKIHILHYVPSSKNKSSQAQVMVFVL